MWTFIGINSVLRFITSLFLQINHHHFHCNHLKRHLNIFVLKTNFSSDIGNKLEMLVAVLVILVINMPYFWLFLSPTSKNFPEFKSSTPQCHQNLFGRILLKSLQSQYLRKLFCQCKVFHRKYMDVLYFSFRWSHHRHSSQQSLQGFQFDLKNY